MLLKSTFVLFKADREKEAQRAREEEERRVRERQELVERAEAERQKAESEQAKERKRNEIRRRLPKEPEASDSRKVARLRFRVPTRGNLDEADEGGAGGNAELVWGNDCLETCGREKGVAPQ